MRRFSRGILAGVGVALALGGAVAQPPSPIPPPVPGTPPLVVPPAATPVTPPAPTPGIAAPPTTPAAPPKSPSEVGGKSLEAWLGEFKSDDPTVRELAVKAMHGFDREAVRRAAVRPLLKLLDDKDPGVRINAILAVNAIGFDKVEDMQEAAAKLAATIRNTHDGSVIRLHAARTLAGFGTEGHKAIPTLLTIVDDPSWETRQAVAAALGRVGLPLFGEAYVADGPTTVKVPKLARPPSDSAMSTLNLRMIRDPSAAVRAEACQALVVLGPPRPANPADYPAKAGPFIKTISDRLAAEKDTAVKIWLQLLIVMYDDRQFDTVLKSLGTQAASAEPAVRVQALQALALLGPKARPALASVTGAMFQPDDKAYVAATAVNTLMSMGDEARAGLADLERLEAETKNENLKKLVTKALKTLRKGKPAAVATPPTDGKKP